MGTRSPSVKPSHSNLLFVGKARSLPKCGAPERSFTPVSLTNIRLGWKSLPGTNTLAARCFPLG